MASGEWVGCFGLTEPDYGSNPGDMITRAVEDGDDFILNGAKMWITNGTIADVAIVWAKLDGVIRGFIVEKDGGGRRGKGGIPIARPIVNQPVPVQDQASPLRNSSSSPWRRRGGR